MTDYYVDENFAGTSDGSITAPWKALSDLNGKDYDLIDNIFFALSTSYYTTSRTVLNNMHNITMTTYDAGHGSARPIFECYTTNTTSGDWYEVQNNGVTPVVSAGDTNLWRLALTTAYWNPPTFVSFGGLGLAYYGLRKRWFLDVYNVFDQTSIPSANSTFIEFDYWIGDPVGLNSSLYVYCTQNPIDEYGTIYYQTGQNPVFMLNDPVNAITDNLEVQNSYCLVWYEGGPTRTSDVIGTVIRNSRSEFSDRLFTFGGNGVNSCTKCISTACPPKRPIQPPTFARPTFRERCPTDAT